MIEDDQTVEEMRIPKARPESRSFMAAGELRLTRCTVLRVSQARLAEQLIDPSNGRPVSGPAVCLWETGRRPVPLWAARRIKDLAEAAKRYDLRKGGE
jgi:hypothetical protein